MKYMGAFAYPVGDSEASNAQILALMGSRVKTGVCDSWSIYEDQTEDLRVVGSVDIALNWGGAPAIAIRTLSVERIVFGQPSKHSSNSEEAVCFGMFGVVRVAQLASFMRARPRSKPLSVSCSKLTRL